MPFKLNAIGGLSKIQKTGKDLPRQRLKRVKVERKRKKSRRIVTTRRDFDGSRPLVPGVSLGLQVSGL